MIEITAPFMFENERNPFAATFRAKLDALTHDVDSWNQVRSEVIGLILRLDRVNKPGGGKSPGLSGRIIEVGPGTSNVAYRAESTSGGLSMPTLQQPLYRQFDPPDVKHFPAAVGDECILWIDPDQKDPELAVRLWSVFEAPDVGDCTSGGAATAREIAIEMLGGRASAGSAMPLTTMLMYS